MQTKDSDGDTIFVSRLPHFDILDVSVGQYCYEKLRQYEDKVLLIDSQTGESLTGKQLITRAQNLSVALLNRGITKTDIILLHSHNSLPHAVAIYAANFLGITITLSKPSHGTYEIENQIIDSGASLVFTSLATAHTMKQAVDKTQHLKQVKHVFVFDGQFEGFESYDKLLKEGENKLLDQIPYFSIDPKNDTILIAYTSGTTGLPKGAMITHYALVGCIMVYNKYCFVKYETVLTGIYPFGHITGMVFLLILISVGGTMIIIPNPDIKNILEAVQTFRISLFGVFPGSGTALLDNSITDKYDLSSIDSMCTGGTSFPSEMGQKLIQKYKLKQFVEFYGMTESIGGVTNITPSEKFVPGNVGELAPNMKLKIVDIQTGDSLGIDSDGEIRFSGPIMMKGYLNNPTATSAAIDSNGWLHTGDVGRVDKEGRIFITDRLKEMVKFRYFTMFPAEIEDCLLRHPAVSEAAVIGVKHQNDGQWLRAYVVVKKGFNTSSEDIQKFVSDRMAFQKQLRAGVVFVDKMPRTIIGKIDRQYFKNLAKDEILS